MVYYGDMVWLKGGMTHLDVVAGGLLGLIKELRHVLNAAAVRCKVAKRTCEFVVVAEGQEAGTG